MNLFEKKHIDNIESLKNYYDKFNIIKKQIFNKNLSIVILRKIKDFNDEIFDKKIILLNLGKGKNEINKTKEILLKLFKRLDDISNIIFGNDNLNDKFLSFTQKDEIENKKK
jgi:lipoate synthase